MSARAAVVCLLFCIQICSTARAQAGPDLSEVLLPRTFAFSIAPSVGYAFGHTTYDFRISSPVAAVGEPSYLRSELEFPLDQFMIGGVIRVRSYLGEVEDWSIQLGGRVSATNPGGTMFDTDWIRVVGGYDGIFSYTESSAEGSNIIVDFEFVKRLLGSSKTTLGVVAGFRYQRIKLEVDNFAGWQVNYENPNPQRVTFEVDNTPALEYRVTYLMPQVGVRLATQMSEGFSLDARALYGLTFADDFDDHILRNKESTADGRGNAFRAVVRSEWLLNERRPGARPFVGFDAELVTLRVNGEQTQVWYADEVVQGEVIVPEGTRFTDLPHDFISTQYQIGLRFGFRF